MQILATAQLLGIRFRQRVHLAHTQRTHQQFLRKRNRLCNAFLQTTTQCYLTNKIHQILLHIR